VLLFEVALVGVNGHIARENPAKALNPRSERLLGGFIELTEILRDELGDALVVAGTVATGALDHAFIHAEGEFLLGAHGPVSEYIRIV
jgi:hypothetical protein